MLPHKETKNILKVGLDFAAPVPLHTDLSSEKFEGFEVDLMNEIAKELKLTLKYSVSYWKNIINDITHGKIEVICSAATITAERKKTLAFSKPYLNFHLCLVCHKNFIFPLKELANKKVGVRVRTEAEDYLKANYPKNNLTFFETNEEQYKSLAKNEIDAVIDDSPIAFGFTTQNSEIMIAELIAGTPSQYAIIINKENVDLKNKIDNVIDKLEENGFLNENRIKWFNETYL